MASSCESRQFLANFDDKEYQSNQWQLEDWLCETICGSVQFVSPLLPSPSVKRDQRTIKHKKDISVTHTELHCIICWAGKSVYKVQQ